MTAENLRLCLSQNIKKFRQKMNLTQENLAEKTNLSLQTINGIEGCRSWVSDKSLTRIAAVLETTPAELLLPPSDLTKADFSQAFIALSELKIELQGLILGAVDKKIQGIKSQAY